MLYGGRLPVISDFFVSEIFFFLICVAFFIISSHTYISRSVSYNILILHGSLGTSCVYMHGLQLGKRFS